MAKKDFTQASTKRVYEAIAEATQEAPEAVETQEEEETAEPKRKRYKDRKEYTTEETEKFLDSFQSAGRKGIKLPRINCAFTPENLEYVSTMARVRGESKTAFINWLIKTHKDENIDMYNKAHEFLDNM